MADLKRVYIASLVVFVHAIIKLKSKYKMSKSQEGNRKEQANEIPWSELNFKRLKETD